MCRSVEAELSLHDGDAVDDSVSERVEGRLREIVVDIVQMFDRHS